MKDPILVTGGTGRLGRVLVPRLSSAGHPVRVLTRRPPADMPSSVTMRRGDLLTGEGLSEAVDGVATIVHCATGFGRTEIDGTRHLIAAAKKAGRPHLIYMSIVGIDRVRLSYYRSKLACEQLLEASGIPVTIQRATQFHDLILMMCTAQRWVPAILMPTRVRFQPIDTGDVAERLTELAAGPPTGRAPDMGGPEIRTAVDLARAYARHRSLRRPVVPVPLPGIRGLRAGGNLAPDHAVGRVTFEQFLAS